MKALVTGATGFVGSHLTDVLLDRGFDVCCAVRGVSDPRWLAGRPVRQAQVDFSRPETFERVFDSTEVVFHVAGRIKGRAPRDYFQGNVVPSRTLIEATLRYGRRVRRFVHISSLAATGPSPDDTPVDEASPCRPISHYGRSKLAGELEVWKHRDKVPVTVVRPPAVYGPRDTAFAELCMAVRTGFVPRLSGRRCLSIVQVLDLVKGIFTAGTDERGAGHVYFVSNEEKIDVEDFIALIVHLMNKRVRRVYLPDPAILLAGDLAALVGRFSRKAAIFNRDKASELVPRRWICSPRKFREHFGWAPQTPLDRGFAEVLQWYRAEGVV